MSYLPPPKKRLSIEQVKQVLTKDFEQFKASFQGQVDDDLEYGWDIQIFDKKTSLNTFSHLILSQAEQCQKATDEAHVERITRAFVNSEQVLLCSADGMEAFGVAGNNWEAGHLWDLIQSTGWDIVSHGEYDCIPVSFPGCPLDERVFVLIGDREHQDVIAYADMQVEAGYDEDINFAKCKPDYTTSFSMSTSWREWKVSMFPLTGQELASDYQSLLWTNERPLWAATQKTSPKGEIYLKIKNNEASGVLVNQLDKTTELKNQLAHHAKEQAIKIVDLNRQIVELKRHIEKLEEETRSVRGRFS